LTLIIGFFVCETRTDCKKNYPDEILMPCPRDDTSAKTKLPDFDCEFQRFGVGAMIATRIFPHYYYFVRYGMQAFCWIFVWYLQDHLVNALN